MSEQQVQQQQENARPDITVVTPENFKAYVDDKLGVVEETPEQVAEKEFAELEAKKAEQEAEKKALEDPTHDIGDTVTEEKKGKLNKRFSEITAARKAAEERAEQSAQEAKAAKEAAAERERELAALREKYEPKKPDVLGPEPKPDQFTDIDEYTKAVKDWAAESAIRERDAKEAEARQAKEREAIAKSWSDRQEAVKAELPDYEATINASTVQLSDQIRDAILKSEVGPRVLYHLAKNPDVAAHLATLTVADALIQFGEIKASLTKEAKAVASASSSVAEISKAPPPITPIRAGAGAESTKVDSKGEFIGTYEEYKRLRQAGKLN